MSRFRLNLGFFLFIGLLIRHLLTTVFMKRRRFRYSFFFLICLFYVYAEMSLVRLMKIFFTFGLKFWKICLWKHFKEYLLERLTFWLLFNNKQRCHLGEYWEENFIQISRKFRLIKASPKINHRPMSKQSEITNSLTLYLEIYEQSDLSSSSNLI